MRIGLTLAAQKEAEAENEEPRRDAGEDIEEARPELAAAEKHIRLEHPRGKGRERAAEAGDEKKPGGGTDRQAPFSGRNDEARDQAAEQIHGHRPVREGGAGGFLDESPE